MLKCLNPCFSRLRSWKSVSSKTAVNPSSRFPEFKKLFQNWSCAKHWFKKSKDFNFHSFFRTWNHCLFCPPIFLVYCFWPKWHICFTKNNFTSRSTSGLSTYMLDKYYWLPTWRYTALYNVILRIPRNILETRKNVKISTQPFYHKNLDWFS